MNFEKPYILTSAAFLAVSIGGVTIPAEVRIEPIVPRNPVMILAAIMRERECSIENPDTNGEPHNPLTGGKPTVSEKPQPTYPVRRIYGRKGQIGNRARGDIRTHRYR